MEEKALVDIYREVLADIDTRFLTRGDKAGLSGLFLPSMPDCYASARNKVMVVGCETRAWYVKLPKKDENFLHGYIDSAMDTHRQHLVCELKKSKSRGRCGTFQPKSVRKGSSIRTCSVTHGKKKALLKALIWKRSCIVRNICSRRKLSFYSQISSFLQTELRQQP